MIASRCLKEDKMIQELPIRYPATLRFRFKRYFESKNKKIRIFGHCEVTGRNYEAYLPTEGFFVYAQGFKSIDEAFASHLKDECDFLVNGISPEGRKMKEQTL